MQVTISNEQQHTDITPKLIQAVETAVARALAVAGAPADAAVDVTLVDDAEIHDLNREWRAIDSPTDVLSFALNDDGDLAVEPEGAKLLGDVIISVERAVAQAAEYGHTFARELAYLAVHGTLHLLGFDHDGPQGQAAMRAKEEEVLRQLGLGRDNLS